MDHALRGKLKLMAPTEAHYCELYPKRYRPEVVRWADDQPQIPELEEFLARRRSRQADPTCIERIILLDEAPIGTITAFGINRFSRDCELGVVLVDPKSWGRGLGPRAMQLFFRVLCRVGIESVHLETFVDNTRAQNAFRKVGFGVRHTYWDRDIGREIVVMSLDLQARRNDASVCAQDDDGARADVLEETLQLGLRPEPAHAGHGGAHKGNGANGKAKVRDGGDGDESPRRVRDARPH